MKLLIVGATYMDNFGDMLFAKLIIEKLKEKIDCRFYLTSDYCKGFIGENSLSLFEISEADALLYMPGGYFGDRDDTSLYTTYLWYKRYFPVGLRFIRRKKPILILGVDAGPCKHLFMRMIIKKICKKLPRIVVRNEESKKFLMEKIKVPSEKISVTSDYAHLIVKYELPIVEPFDKWKDSNKKQILLHVNECENAKKVIIPALKKFFIEHQNQYQIVVASDQTCPNDIKTLEEVKKFAGENVFYHKYGSNPLELCSIIKSCDCVITYKLHVGIVAAAYSKSVISVPQHYKKVQKYYNHIGYSERCLPLIEATVDNVYKKIKSFINIPVILSDEIRNKTIENDVYLNEFINSIINGEKNGK